MLLMSGIFMFAVIGGISLLAHYYTLNGIKSKTVGDGQHGTARFATREEIRDTYEQIPYEPELWRKGEHLPTAQGIILGSVEQHGKLYALVDTDDVHCLMIGAAGIGKTANFLYPNLEYACACGMSFLTQIRRAIYTVTMAVSPRNTMVMRWQSLIYEIQPAVTVTICSIWSINIWMSI